MLAQQQGQALGEIQKEVALFFEGALQRLFREFRSRENFDASSVYRGYLDEAKRTFEHEDRRALTKGPKFPVREKEGSIFVSIAAYRDNGLNLKPS